MKLLVRVIYWPGWIVIKSIVTVLAKVEVVGADKLPERSGIIIASNHLSNADPPVLGTALRRRMVFMAKVESMGWPLVGFIIRLSGALPVRRFEADIGALRKAAEVLRDGQLLTMFPEGTRSKTAALGPGHPGTALIALRSGAPILPVAITGTEQLRPLDTLLHALRFHRRRVKVTIGDPFFLPSVSRISAEEVRRCTDIVMQHIAALLPPQYHGQYAEPGDQPSTQPHEVAG